MVDRVINMTGRGGRGGRGGIGLSSGPLGAESVTAETINGADANAIADKIGAMRPNKPFVSNFTNDILPIGSASGLYYFNADLNSSHDLIRLAGTIQEDASSYLLHVTANSEAGAANGGAVGLAMSGSGAIPTLVVNRYEDGNASAILVNKVGTGDRFAVEASFSSTGIGGAAQFTKQNSGAGDGAGTGPAVDIQNISDTGLALRSTTSSNNTEVTSHIFERRNTKNGTNVDVQLLLGGTRTGAISNLRSIVQPVSPSTGSFAIAGHEVILSSNVQGSVSAVGSSVSNDATGGAAAYGTLASVTGANTTNYGVYGNATGATNNHAGYFVGQVSFGGLLTPLSDNVQNLGSSGARMAVIYAATGSINTSDAREKNWIDGIDDAHIRAGQRIISELGFYQWIKEVENKGSDKARLHFGARAQDVVRIFVEEGLEIETAEGDRPSFRHAFLCYDEWEDEENIPIFEQAVENVPVRVNTGLFDKYEKPILRDGTEQITITKKTAEKSGIKAGNRYGLRLDQLALFLAAVNSARIDRLEAKLA